ncbi:hypothetical protein CSB08_00165 [Candidatus Gracilibacteria bacterium]|nr:MAG: hypothetical protein CSB08_00165 [Candidatus Gracilibacteria bacterium]PIE85259.1 MAG: hypothetical protein CSA08_02515 [Candidatus Gracilibacteria bacterium]
MSNYLAKLLILIVFSFVIIYYYYYVFPVHIENFDGYLPYVLVLLLIYGVYKFFTIKLSKTRVRFSPFSLFLFFLLHLFILSTILFSIYNQSLSGAFILFFKIISYSVLPISIIIITASFGYKLLGLVKNFDNESPVFRYLSSLGVGFSLFLFLLASFGVLGFYNLYAVFFILILFLVIGFKEFINFFYFFFNYKVEFKNHDFSSNKLLEIFSLKLISSEFLFIVSTFILSINLINIVRPFPIGWDDLGVYMNYPKMLASSGSLDILGGMFSWQTFTGIGFMFNSPVQAFFLNVLGGFMSFIVLILVVKDLLLNNEGEKVKEDTIINVPLLVSTIFISMPMVIFQQAKDMKLDPGLFFVSLIAIYMFYYLYKSYFRDKEEKEKLDNKRLFYLFVIGFIFGLAFSIKFTSLMLISGIIGVLFFVRLGVAGFLGYLSIYFSIFTGANLWRYMNISIPDDLVFRKTFLIIGFLIGIMLLVYSKVKYKKRFKILFIKLGVILLGLSVFLIPWIGKNLAQSDTISISKILSGQTNGFKEDYSKIYNEEELSKLNSSIISSSVSSSGVTSNEDFGRYFGYEKGINNYIKLPWNLTMQKNQGGEFTDITFLFLALLPTILLFLPYRRNYFPYVLIIPILFLVLCLSIPGVLEVFTKAMANIKLPFGYIFILFSLLIFLVFRYLLVKGVKNIKIFKINLIFTIFYTFLWTISAFGIVWYGIMMYFGFLLMIAIGIYYLSNYDNKTSEKEINVKIFGSLAVFSIICFHFFFSTFPHGFNNLKNAWYLDFKTSKTTSDEDVFLQHSGYSKLLFELNILPEKRSEFIKSNISKQLIQKFPNLTNPDIDVVLLTLANIIYSKDVPSNYKAMAINSRRAIFSGILKPEKEYISDAKIYRIGTFIKYFTINSNSRFLNDNLITKFDNYIYDDDYDKVFDRIKKLGLKYFLVDLNAATIDKDKNHYLTKRYEKVLKTFTSDKIELVSTNSACLRVALEYYDKSNKSEIDLQNYLTLAGVNYDSFYPNNIEVGRKEKMIKCYSFIFNLIKNKNINEKSYPFLLNLYNYINNAKLKKLIKTDQDIFKILSRYINHGNKVLFKIK